ncbi:MAG TPA: type 4a pilus biogenesis protein PilO [Mycobacteriales bacterium]|nr:type 4a pilus biogenesis protein PilO [Mycobacteriales bacterium]
MSSKMKQWVALTAVGVLAVMAAGWFLLISPKRTEAALVRDEVTSQEGINQGLQTQLAMLKQQAKTLPAQQAKLARVATKIPDNPAQPALIRALSDAADEAGVELISMAPGQPVAVAAAPATLAAPAPGAAPQGTSSLTTTASAAYNPGVLTTIPLAINVVGGYFQVEQFFDRLENLARAAKVTGFTMLPGTNPLKPQTGASGASADTGKVLTVAVQANVYMAVGRGAAVAATVPVK